MMEFIWHDGGRASSGYVGSTGDCVTRSIAIATGMVYREVYRLLSELSHKTARHGISLDVCGQYLRRQGWKKISADRVAASELPRGAAIVLFQSKSQNRNSHLSCVIDHTIYDTWNPLEDPEFRISGYWIHESHDRGARSPMVAPSGSPSAEPGEMTQSEFDKILNRVKALHRTASNAASTEGEIRNAMRMMQNLMLRHNLNRSDIVEDDDVRHVGMTRRACPLNGRRCYQWESMLAHYMIEEIFPTVQFYQDRHGHRTLFWFYGPVADVQQTIELFREILLTIATAARLKFGGYARGSGASYAEGYVQGLPRSHRDESSDERIMSEEALIHARTLAIHSAATRWLNLECGIKLQSYRGSGRYGFDGAAHQAGKIDGAKHDVSGPYQRKRLARPG